MGDTKDVEPEVLHSVLTFMADLRGAPETRPLIGLLFFHVHAIVGEVWPNNRLVPPPMGLASPSEKSWIMDLRGHRGRTPTLLGANIFFNFKQFSGGTCLNNRGIGAPSGKSWIRHW